VDDSGWIFDRYAQDLDVCRYMTWVPHREEASVRDWLDVLVGSLSSGHHAAWVIFQGDQGIGMIDARYPDHACELGYVLARPAWGHGYMTEVVCAIRDVVMAVPEVHRLWACADVENGASARVMEKAGMEREGRLRRYIRHPNLGDLPRDVFLHSYIRPPKA
jgi:RimJ/RimL family protein N-acetyltransferase